jgi:predicted nucleotidyltransferase
VTTQIAIDREQVSAFCRRWQVAELSLFGSVLREDFRPDSDVDVLIGFAPGARWGLFDFAAMEDELGAIVGRKVDLVSRRAVESSSNYIRRGAILSSAQTLHAAG